MIKRSSPEFWQREGCAAQLLAPLAWANSAAGAARQALARPRRAGVPVICVGNAVAGGAGKTPVVLSLAERLAAGGARPGLLTRGYGGASAGPLAVDPRRHDADMVGDEALLLARAAPTVVAHDRVAGARAAVDAGATIIVMDDGFQNPSLAKDCSLLVIDGAYGLGNGRVIPAGPLREKLEAALDRADAVVLMGRDETSLVARLSRKPVLEAALVAVPNGDLAGPIVAFAGIGRPEKFFRTLAEAGGASIAQHGFPDHHRYGDGELRLLGAEAERAKARLFTTAKDWVRLAPESRARVHVLEVEVAWRDEAALAGLLARASQARA